MGILKAECWRLGFSELADLGVRLGARLTEVESLS